MTYNEFLTHLERADLTLKEFAQLVRMNRTSLSNYAKPGEVPSHLAIIALLMGQMEAQGVDFRSTLQKVVIVTKKPRGAGRDGRFGGDKQRQFDVILPGRK